MKSILTVFATSIILSCSTLPVALSAPASDRDEIQIDLDRINQALINKDVKELVASDAPDCTSKQMDGKIMTHQQLIASAPEVFDHVTFVSASTTILTFSIKAGKAYLTTKDHAIAVFIDPRTKRSITLTEDDTESEIWRKIAGQWKEEFSQTTSEHVQPRTAPAAPAGQGV